MTIEAKRPLVVIGTSGSTDYLHDKTRDRRFWPVSATSAAQPSDDSDVCDGLHDEGAPPQYLCSRCFPDPQGDLAVLQDDEYDESCRDEDREME